MSVTSEYSEREYSECCLDTPKAPIRSAVNVIMRLGLNLLKACTPSMTCQTSDEQAVSRVARCAPVARG